MAWQPSASIAALTRRARLLGAIREFFAARDVLEVQTPVLGQFGVTDPDVPGIAVPDYGFLQTSPEYFMKRLLAAGMPDCYQLGPAFRDGESGRLHNPEFTLLEWYRHDYDDQQLMAEVAELVSVLLGPADVATISYAELVFSDRYVAHPCAVDAPRDVLDLRFAEACRQLSPGRFFIVDYPADQAALARLRPAQDPAARFELVIDGIEIANGYWELVDADEHERRFAQDNRLRAGRGLPSVEADPELLAALRSGLPDCAGVAVGVDRLLMLVLQQPRIGAVMPFAWHSA
ncbi:MAG: amino acid--tRNA ligase-related protein [Pseudomonadota bacterium]